MPRANESAAPEVIAGARPGGSRVRKVVKPAGAERGRRLLDLRLELEQHRLHRAHDERQRDEQERQEDRDPGVGPVDARAGSTARTG